MNFRPFVYHFQHCAMFGIGLIVLFYGDNLLGNNDPFKSYKTVVKGDNNGVVITGTNNSYSVVENTHHHTEIVQVDNTFINIVTELRHFVSIERHVIEKKLPNGEIFTGALKGTRKIGKGKTTYENGDVYRVIRYMFFVS